MKNFLLLFSALFVVALLLTACGPTPTETTFVDTNGLKYALNKDGESYSVVGIGTRNGTDIVIASRCRGKPVTGIGYRAFFDCDWLTSVTIPDSVTNIGRGAFSHCSGLTNITIPDSVTSVGDDAFEDCESLTSIAIGNGVTSIGNRAFIGCTELTNITIPDSVTSIGDYTFNNCKSLTNITIPDSITSIGAYAFILCRGLTNITIPDSVTSIGDGAFSHCNGLTNITIPNSVTSIGVAAFENCSSLTSIVISNSVKSIAGRAFEGCIGLTSITIPDSVTSIGWAVFRNCTSLTTVTMPDGVTSIDLSAFENCSSLTSIDIPNSVTYIGRGVFEGCSSLSFNVYDNACYLGNNNNPYLALMSATSTSITTCTFHKDIKVIAEGAFDNCNQIQSFLVESGYVANLDSILSKYDVSIKIESTEIENGAFAGLTNLKNITISDSVTSIGERAFENCGLVSITIPVNVVNISNYAFYNCTSLTSITIEGNVTNIGDFAFSGCTNVTEIKIPDSVTDIGNHVFDGCNKLTQITIPASVTNIGSQVFSNCESLTSIIVDQNNTVYHSNGNCLIETETGTVIGGCGSSTIPNDGSITSIGDFAFQNCTFVNLTIPVTVTNIENYAFYGCHALTNIVLPDTLISVGAGVFDDCPNLIYNTYNGANYLGSETNPYLVLVGIKDSAVSSYQIHESTKIIAGSAFEGCTSLKSVIIPEGVTYIGDRAFYGCDNLAEITISASVTSIGDQLFTNCHSLVKIAVDQENTVYHSSGNCLIETATKVLVAGCNASVIPTDESVTSIGEYAFENCTFVNITIPVNIINIQNYAFYNCVHLTEIVISDSILSVGSGAFENCDKLVYNNYGNGIYLGNEENPYLVFIKAVDTSISSCQINEKTKVIADEAFKHCYKLNDVTIPCSITSIGESAFYGCWNLRNVIIPDGVTSIDAWAFYGCWNLVDIRIPDSITAIGEYAFYLCNKLSYTVLDNACYLGNELNPYVSLVNITDQTIVSSHIHENTKIVYHSAFRDCRVLNNVVIPNSAVYIGHNAFRNCIALADITYEGTKAEWEAVEKYYDWDYYTGVYTVHCTDGDIAKE